MRILMIEDDKSLCDAVRPQLENAGYQVDDCQDGMDSLYYVLQPVYDLIILDRMLPGMDGLSLLKTIRATEVHTPVIITTALDAVVERINGLDCGADDYITKPYDVGELLARIRALVRRPTNMGDPDTLAYADLTYQTDSHVLSTSHQSAQLSKREAVLMEYFLQNPEQILPRQMIYSRTWGPDRAVEDGNLDTYIYYLRKHLRTLHSQVQIATIHGVGYKLE